ncbi:LysR family transcriptional regulator [Wenzhouxiangella sp. XN79A]|uniref:LysR family transcriptional regulator n=1 Tax=Wenzhouxiangella sp. XN79A TaxID=2724193 RepID=UPI00144ACC7D|nr:LysR family transcriptional regulator [Wenzhouxiangella sp. XN79A]NKI34519.1 LysR family transcriptional regulator [Wenzhouxiangella sp. XN79A]
MYKGNLLKHLRAFCQTARTGTVSGAAERLYVSQPSVSQQIRALEEELGQQLFDRQGSRLHLTPAGRTLLELARPLVDRIDALPDEFARAFGRLDSGEIRIAAGESTILHLLPALLQRFRRQHPGIFVHLHNVTGADGMGLIRSDEVDFAVGSMIDVPDDISYRPIYSFKPVLIAHRDHPLARRRDITLADISPYGLILPPRRLTTYTLIDRVFQKHKLPFRVTLEVGGWEVIKKFVKQGMGISIVTSICLGDSDRDELVTRDVSRWFPQRTYGVVMRKGAYLTPQARRFIELMSPDLFPEPEFAGRRSAA